MQDHRTRTHFCGFRLEEVDVVNLVAEKAQIFRNFADGLMRFLDDIEEIPAEQIDLPGFGQLLARRHARSGWPVALELIGREAWRR